MFRYIKVLLRYWLTGWLILLSGRFLLIALFMSFDQITADKDNIGLALWNIIRFDFQALSYLAALPLLTAIVAMAINKSRWWDVFTRWFYTITYTMLTILVISDLCFYKNFTTHLNITVFDFFNELPLTLIQTFWEDYPAIPCVLAVVGVAVALHFVGKKFTSCPPAGNRGGVVPNILISLAGIAFIVVCMRGSVTEFPLQVEDTCVSAVKQLNDCIPNAPYALKTAWQEKSNAFNMNSKEEILAEYKFESEEEAMKALGIDSLFTTSTGVTDANQPQNIIVVFSESWSGFLCHDNINNPDIMLGMERHLQEDLWFKNYQSVHNGTIASLENFVMATSLPRIFQTGFRFTKLEASITRPFKESGYETVFMTGMDKAWENVGEGIELQGFDKIESKYELLAKHPEYKFNSIGVYDHHLFNTLLELLKEPTKKQRFYYVLTTTNHPPYVFPDDVKMPALPESYYAKSMFDEDDQKLKKIIYGFQYANYSMAHFLDALKKSDAAERTVVIITGDHNVRGTLRYEDRNGAVPTKWAHAVPLYIYLPKHLRKTADGTYTANTSTYGCHYDLLPTIAPFAFKEGVRYLNVGKNMLSDSISSGDNYSYNTDATLTEPANAKTAELKARARECLLKLQFHKNTSSR